MHFPYKKAIMKLSFIPLYRNKGSIINVVLVNMLGNITFHHAYEVHFFGIMRFRFL